ncbi:MAG TPA: metalloregulator ArsR/SmtB family transcription factor [Gammaproteobacteria bacterium]|nr:metalloregulator ArsR/SmtB family transcription factor [Gammaproteobacteria bacterium]
MKHKDAVHALGALAHESRLTIYRLLVQAGPAGLAVGAIGEKLGLPPATLSFHLAGLRHAGLANARREGRILYQAADYGAMNDLVAYLSENCCQGAGCGITARAPKSRSTHQEPSHETSARSRRRR